MRLTMRTIMASGALAALAACSDSSGPGEQGSFDSRRVKDGLATVEQVGASPVLKSFQALGGQLGAAAAVPGISGTDRYLAAVQNIAGIVRPQTQAALVPIIRSSMLGKTLVYDPATKAYVASNRTGAPSNGVRFVLYQNDAENRPIVAQEIGTADLTDTKASSATSAGLRLVVTSNGKTYLDYSFDLSGTIAVAVVTVDGYMSDGTDRVDFKITTTGQLFGRGGTATIDAKLEVAAQQFKIAAKVKGPAGGGTGPTEIELTVTAGSDVVAVTSKDSGSSLDAKVTVNGNLFATVTGTSANPVIKGDGGRELTAEELAALGEVVKFAEGVFELIGGLLAPVGALLLIGLGL